jgi:16S rRNA processing protein RimM
LQDHHRPIAFLQKVSWPEDTVELGYIGRPWGIQGWFKVHPHNLSTEVLFTCKEWFIRFINKQQKTSHTSYTDRFSGGLLCIKQLRTHQKSFVAQVDQIRDRQSASLLQGGTIFICRKNFPPLPINDYYWTDLIGMQVINQQNNLLGIVENVFSAGSQTTLSITPTQSKEQKKSILIPFVKAYVDKVDKKSGSIMVDWQRNY